MEKGKNVEWSSRKRKECGMRFMEKERVWNGVHGKGKNVEWSSWKRKECGMGFMEKEMAGFTLRNIKHNIRSGDCKKNYL